jgi:predicted RNA-binding Zn-ribbon protein involved in translation (DUF1610 family)
MNDKLEWEYLKELNCPKCYKDLVREGNLRFKCLDCGFVITEERLREVVIKMCNEEKDFFGRENFEELLEATK